MRRHEKKHKKSLNRSVIHNNNNRRMLSGSTFNSLKSGESMINGLVPEQKIKIKIRVQWLIQLIKRKILRKRQKRTTISQHQKNG
jgi:hypothetical protein